MRIISIFVTLIIVILGVAFTTLNAQKVDVNYLIGDTTLPLAVLMLLAFVLGSLMTLILVSFGLVKLKAKNVWLSSQLKRMEAALDKH